MPGIVGAIGGAISAYTAGTVAYGTSIGAVFPARASSNSTLAASLGLAPGLDRTASVQAGMMMFIMIIHIIIYRNQKVK